MLKLTLIRVPHPRFSSWLDYPLGRLVYWLAWLAFAVGFAGFLWFGGKVSILVAIRAASYTIGPAALLGLGVIFLCSRLPWQRAPLRATLAHLVCLVAYPSIWVIAVLAVGSLDNFLHKHEWQASWPPEHVMHWHLLSGALLYVTLVVTTYSFDWTLQAESARQRAELRSIGPQLKPHFLFNTLHVLLALSRTDRDAAEDGMDRFVKLLGYVLRLHREGIDEVPFSEEWSFTRDYLELEQIRYGQRVRWEAIISDDAWDCQVPPLLLQPIVENAIRHGIAPREGGGLILIEAAVQDGRMVLNIKDDGLGCSTEEALLSNGVGLRSLRARLASMYAGRAHWKVTSRPGYGCAVSIDLPYATQVQ
jgi:hypothetical protein